MGDGVRVMLTDAVVVVVVGCWLSVAWSCSLVLHSGFPPLMFPRLDLIPYPTSPPLYFYHVTRSLNLNRNLLSCAVATAGQFEGCVSRIARNDSANSSEITFVRRARLSYSL
jgi:hypothetical protein